jgi:signal transduction histidine kinase
MLGRQQIAGIPTAIHELFKNAHDAYAEHVEVDYFRSDEVVVLRDDGFGMTKDEFESRWLTIGTESKVGANLPNATNPIEPTERPRPIMGEKGIGRLAIAAIGPQVLIVSRAIRDKVLHAPVVSLVNWGLFEVPGLDLDSIDVPVHELKPGSFPDLSVLETLVTRIRTNVEELGLPQPYRSRILAELDAFDLDPAELAKSLGAPTIEGEGHGTHFIICPVNPILSDDIDSGSDDAASPLQKMLLGFSNTMMPDRPEPVIVAEFRDHHEHGTDELIAGNAFFTPDEFDGADHHIEGLFDEYGQFEGNVSVYKQAAVAHTIQWPRGTGRRTECGAFRIKFAYVQGRANESRLPPADWALISSKLNRIGGLYVYRDGIRILPYGNSDYDFLNIERRRTKSAQDWFFSYRRIFGAVEITHTENSNLVEKAGREGFRANRAYREFVDILEHFFERLAIDFFRPTAVFGHEFNTVKQQLTKEAELLAKREIQTRSRRRALTGELNRFFEALEGGRPSSEAESIRRTLVAQIAGAIGSDEEDRAAQLLLDAELTARQSSKALVDQFTLRRPRGIGLNKTQERDWAAYVANFRKLSKEVFAPLEVEIDRLISEASAAVSGALDRRRRITASLEARRQSATGIASRLRRQVQTQVAELSHEVNESLRTSVTRLNRDIEQTFLELGRTDTATATEDDLVRLQRQWETRVDETTTFTRDLLEGLRDQLEHVVRAVHEQETLDATTAAIESEAESLRDQLNTSVELAQVGMALGIVQHEFTITVRGIRNALRKLKPWAEGTPALRSVERELRTGFDHLDTYLNLFTPMSRRLNRDRVELSGEEIRKYLDEVFGDRLRRHEVDLRYTSEFDIKVVTGFTSTFLPSFVNLVDNAVYWVQTGVSDERWIQLDADADGFLISNSGPGIEARIADRIFDFGETTKPGGRGMGLYLSREALRKEKFDLRLESVGGAEAPVFRIVTTSSEAVETE